MDVCVLRTWFGWAEKFKCIEVSSCYRRSSCLCKPAQPMVQLARCPLQSNQPIIVCMLPRGRNLTLCTLVSWSTFWAVMRAVRCHIINVPVIMVAWMIWDKMVEGLMLRGEYVCSYEVHPWVICFRLLKSLCQACAALAVSYVSNSNEWANGSTSTLFEMFF